MAKTRETKVIYKDNISTDEAESLIGEYAALDAKEQNITSKMDLEITKIREKYADDLSEIAEKKKEKFERLQYFAQTHEELFVKKKSFEMAHGKIGFRDGNPTVKTLKGFTWASVTTLLQNFLPGYVKTEVVPMKEKLLADRENEDVNKFFTKCGIEVKNEERFFVDLKKEEVKAA